MLDKFINADKTTLVGSVNNSSNPVTIAVLSAAVFPTSGNFYIIIESEILLVTAVSGTNLTASRAQEGTTIASHANGTNIAHVLTAQGLKNIINQRLYSVELTPPDESTLAWVNQGTATIDFSGGYTYLEDQMTNGEQNRLRVKSLPATPWTKTICISPNSSPAALYPGFGMCIRESSSGKITTFGLLFRNDSSSGGQLLICGWNNPTTQAGFQIVESHTSGGCKSGRLWLRIADDGTNRTYLISSDGVHFNLWYSEANTTRIVADQNGYYMNPYGAQTSAYKTGGSVLSLD